MRFLGEGLGIALGDMTIRSVSAPFLTDTSKLIKTPAGVAEASSHQSTQRKRAPARERVLGSGSRAALIAAAEGAPTPTAGPSTRPLTEGGGVVFNGTLSTNRISEHVVASPPAPFSLPEIPQRRFTPQSTLREPTVPDVAGSMNHSAKATAARRALSEGGKVAALAANQSLLEQTDSKRFQGTRFFDAPQEVIATFTAAHPELLQRVSTQAIARGKNESGATQQPPDPFTEALIHEAQGLKDYVTKRVLQARAEGRTVTRADIAQFKTDKRSLWEDTYLRTYAKMSQLDPQRYPPLAEQAAEDSPATAGQEHTANPTRPRQRVLTLRPSLA